MKLRNKKTGEIAEWDFGNWYQHILNPDKKESYECTLSEFIDRAVEFRKEWEDAPEEPKKYWFIDAYGNIVQNEITKHYGDEYTDMTDAYEDQKQIGNYFETKEEAEKAVEKLKAWKRLEDKGFINEQVFSMNLNWCNPDDDDWKAFKLLFGGEE